MKRQRITNLVFLALLPLSACSSPVIESIPTSSLTQTPTTIFTPTTIPSPTLPATASLDSFPTLSGNKPYLMISQDFGGQELFIYDAIGLGRKTIKLPPDGHIQGVNSTLATIVSPDGQWLVFYTGSFSSGSSQENLPITLKLLQITDGTVKKVADVVTDGYKDKLDQVAEKLKELLPDYYKAIDGNDWVSSSVIPAFECSIHAVAWSPDSRTLAFAAQIDGISSDVYLYDLESGAIERLENSIQNISRIRWSPDGKYLVFENSKPGNVYSSSTLHVIEPGKKIVNEPSTLISGTWVGTFDTLTQVRLPIGDWLSPRLLLVTGQTPDAGNHALQALNLETGQLTPLWEDSFISYAIDPESTIVAINASEYAQPENFGLHFITFDGRRTKILDGLYWLQLFFRGGAKHRFLVQGIGGDQTKGQYKLDGDTVGIGLDGKPLFLGKFGYQQISISPDHSWLLMYDDEKMYLYDTNDELVRTFPISSIETILWRPDSQAIFYLADEELFTLPLSTGEPKWVDGNGMNIRDAIWIP